MKKRYYLCILICILMNASVAFSGENNISVKSFNLVKGQNVFLKDIGEIKMENKSYKKMLGNIRITGAPVPAEEKSINGSYIRSKIQRALKKYPVDVELIIPEVVSVKRTHKNIPVSTFEKIFYQYAAKINHGKDFRVGDYSIRGNRPFADGELRFEAAPHDIKKNMGRVSIKINVFSDLEAEGVIFVSAWVDVYDDVVCLTRLVKRGDFISLSDVELKLVNISRIPGDYIRLSENAVGMKADVELKKGIVLRKKVLSRPYMVLKGDAVQVEIHSGNLMVESVGIAKKSGYNGEQIEVENSDTGKIMVGRIRGRNTIEIIF